MNIIKEIFWRFFPDPKIGDKYIYCTAVDDPWNDRFYTVVERQGDWYRIRGVNGYLESRHKSSLLGFFKKIEQ